MSWVVADLIMFGSSVVLFLLIRKVSLSGVPVQFNNLAMFAVPTAAFAIIAVAQHASLAITWQQGGFLLFTGVILAYAGNSMSLRSIELAPNPGYSLVIAKSYVVLTTFLAVPFFGAHLSWQALVAIAMILFSSALILINHRKGEHAKSKAWLPLALGSFVAWAFLSLAAKYAVETGMPIVTFIFYFFLVVVACILIEMRVQRVSLNEVRQRSGWFLLIGLASTGFNFFNFYAISIAPNVGYVNATNAASVGVVTVFAILLFKDEFLWRKLAGVLGVIAGLFFLFLG